MSPFAQVLDACMREAAPAAAPARASRAERATPSMRSFERCLDAWAHAPPAWASELGVAVPCTFDELKRAFRARAFETHPDRSGGSHDAFVRVREAYEDGVRAVERAERPWNVGYGAAGGVSR